MKRSIKVADLLTGLETTGLEDGLELPRWSEFQNARVAEGAAKRRGGMQRVLVADDQYANVNAFDDSEFITVPQNDDQMQLGKHWTIDFIFDVTNVSKQRTIIDFGGAVGNRPLNVFVDVSGDLNATVRTSAGTTTVSAAVSLGATHRAQLSRDYTGAAGDLTLRLDGSDVDTASVGDYDLVATPGDMLFGVDYSGSGKEFLGTIGFIRCLDIALSDQKYGWSILPDPKADFVSWEYVCNRGSATTKPCYDRSRFRNHGYWSGDSAPATNIAQQLSSVSLIKPRLDNKDRARLDVVAGGQVYLGELTR